MDKFKIPRELQKPKPVKRVPKPKWAAVRVATLCIGEIFLARTDDCPKGRWYRVVGASGQYTLAQVEETREVVGMGPDVWVQVSMGN